MARIAQSGGIRELYDWTGAASDVVSEVVVDDGAG